MQKYLIFILLITVTTHIFCEDSKKNNVDPQALVSLADKAEPLSDREAYLVDKIEAVSSVGNLMLATDYYRELMRSFIATDKQTNIIKQSLKVIPCFLAFQDFTFINNLLDHLEYRIHNYSYDSPENLKEWDTTIQWYKILVDLMTKNDGSNTLSSNLETPAIESDLSSPRMVLMLQELVLGLTSSYGSDIQLQHFYYALDMSNNLHNAEFYYIISIILVKTYLAKNEYASALTRLNLLYKLFSDIQTSDYYKIKVLLYFTQVFLAEKENQKAYSAYLRARDMLMFNTSISSQESERLKKILEDVLKPEFINQETQLDNNSFIDNNSFMNDFIQSGY